MMDLEEQVTSLELSKSLKELGIPQGSLFYWVISFTTNYHLSYTEGDKSLLPQDRNDFYSAFTVAELGELLPFAVSSEKKVGIPSLGWRATLEIPTKIIHTEEAKTEADARAKMLVYLIEHEMIRRS